MRKVFTFFLIYALPIFCVAQSPIEALKKQDEQYASEKIHLFLNKEYYLAGESIFYKAYNFSGNVASLISGTLYVELLNGQKNVIQKNQLPLLESVGNGALQLSDTLSEGIYFIRAYTKWMLNFEDSFQYIIPVPIYNEKSALKIIQKPVLWQAIVKPESGNLIGGVLNNLSVRLNPIGRLPEKFSGFVYAENSDKPLIEFESLNPQVASFSFVPDAGKTYKIKVVDNKGNSHISNLKANENGVLLKAAQKNQKLSVSIIFKNLPEQGYTLVAASYGQVFYFGQVKGSNNSLNYAIPIQGLYPGVVQLSLIDGNNKLMAERLVFVQPQPIAPISINASSEAITIHAQSLEPATIAQSTTTNDVPHRTRSILSDVYLGDFKSYIQNGHSYFNNDSIHVQSLDALLMSLSWQRYEWNNILNQKFPTITYKPEPFLSYKGRAFRNKKPIANEMMNLLFKFKDASIQFAQQQTDSFGYFDLSNVAFYDTVKVFYQQNSKKGPSPAVTLQIEKVNAFVPFKGSLPFTEYTIGKPSENHTPLYIADALKARTKGVEAERIVTLQEVKLKAYQKTPTQILDDKISSDLFKMGDQTVFDFVNGPDNLNAYVNVLDWLPGRVPGLRIVNTEEGGMSVDEYTGAPLPMGQKILVVRDGIPALFLDEQPVDPTTLGNVPTSDIAMIKVFKGYFIGAQGGGGGSGAIAVYTRKAGMGGNTAGWSSTAMLEGYNLIKPFEPKKYEVQRLWTPIMLQNGVQRLSDTNAGLPLRTVITGISKDAIPVFQEKTLAP